MTRLAAGQNAELGDRSPWGVGSLTTTDLQADRFGTSWIPTAEGGVSTFDTIDGTDGNDNLTGTSGDDLIDGHKGSDTIHGGDGADTIFGSKGADTLFGQAGDDLIYQDEPGKFGTNGGFIDGGSGDDTLFGCAFNDSITGGTGDDVIEAGSQSTLDGGDGDDTISSEGLNAVITGGAGNDSIAINDGWWSTAALIDTAHGGDGNDRIVLTVLGGSSSAGRLFGDSGDDTLTGSIHNDTLDGGDGADTADYGGDRSGVVVDLVAQTAHGGQIGADTLASIENATGGHHGDQLFGDGGSNLLDGGAGSDVIDGRDGSDTLQGGGGADTIEGGVGQDTLTGGGGRDTFVFSDIAESTKGAPDLITDLGPTDLIDLTAIDADTGTAGVQAFHLASSFSGHAGELVLTYDAGQDVTRIQGDVDGDGQADFTILASGDQHGFTHFAPASDAEFDATLKGGTGDDALTGTGARELIVGLGGDDVLNGLAGDDELLGGAGDDQLVGGSGDDTLDGGGGFDTVQAGSGDDLILLANADGLTDGGSGVDTVSFAQAKFGVTASTGSIVAAGVLAGVEQVIGSDFDDVLTLNGKHQGAEGGGGNDILSGDDRCTLGGGEGDDVLTAGLHNQLDGGAGDDRLISWRADVQMTGGEGADTFVFTGVLAQTAAPNDLITDLGPDDAIDLSGIDADVTTAGDQAFALVGAFDGHAGQAVLSYDGGVDETSLELDTDGDASADIIIRLTGDQTGFSNFVL